MLDHYIQRTIVYRLAFTPGLRFSQLKPDELENKLFTYHLKKVLAEGLVEKSETGIYTLTPEGRRISTGALDKEQSLIVDRAHSVLFLVIRRKQDGAWLFYKRGTHPMLGFSGFMHCNPNAQEFVTETAHLECHKKTGLEGTFQVLGGGYFRIYDSGFLESFTNFTLLYCDEIQGELNPIDPKAEYYWVHNPDFSAEDMFPGTKLLKEYYEAKRPFFIDETFSIGA